MIIKLIGLEMHNFKGIRELSVKFGKVTDIKGENGIGKSTIMESFMWLLFDKDSKDRKNFEIKTIDKQGNVLHGLEHKVTGILEVDGIEIVLSKIYKEKWTKKRGMATKEFTGHETLYSINEVPVKKKEYEDKVKEILDEKIFRLVTNPTYFANLKWQDQREIVQEIIGSIDDEAVINYNQDLAELKGKYSDSVDNYRVRTKATIKKLNDQIKQIPFRIDECNNNIVNEDFSALEVQKNNLEKEITAIDEQLEDSSKGNEILIQHKQKLFNLKQEYQEKLNRAKLSEVEPKNILEKELQEARYTVKDLNYKINDKERDKRSLEDSVKRYKNYISSKKDELESLREKFKQIDSEVFALNPFDKICPTCKRELENADEKIQVLEETFNLEKSKKKTTINKQGLGLKEEISDINKKVTIDTNTIIELTNTIDELNNKKLMAEQEVIRIEEETNNFVVYEEPNFEGKGILESDIENLEQKINSFKIDDNLELKTKKRILQADLIQVNKVLAKQENNINLKDRIKALEREERELSNKVAEYEGQLFLCEEFVRTKVELSEGLINKKFDTLKFKLFNELINGGLDETCEILIDGVPYSNANTASQINPGLEVINTLSNYYNVTAPIFIDNREAVNDITSTENQIINLIVSKDNELVTEVIE